MKRVSTYYGTIIHESIDSLITFTRKTNHILPFALSHGGKDFFHDEMI